jgi:AcrR family transcriptional regulator
MEFPATSEQDKEMGKEITINPLFLRLFQAAPRKGDRRKFQIVEAAIECISTVGIEGTTLELIGKKVGLARRNVAYHFDGVPSIIKAAIQYVVATGQEIAIESLKDLTDWEDQLKAYIHSTFIWIESHPPHAAVMLALFYLSTHHESYRAMNSEIRSAGTGRIEAILLHGSKQGMKCNGIQAKVYATAIYSLLIGNAINFATTDAKESAKALSRETFVRARDLLPVAKKSRNFSNRR